MIRQTLHQFDQRGSFDQRDATAPLSLLEDYVVGGVLLSKPVDRRVRESRRRSLIKRNLSLTTTYLRGCFFSSSVRITAKSTWTN